MIDPDVAASRGNSDVDVGEVSEKLSELVRLFTMMLQGEAGSSDRERATVLYGRLYKILYCGAAAFNVCDTSIGHTLLLVWTQLRAVRHDFSPSGELWLAIEGIEDPETVWERLPQAFRRIDARLQDEFRNALYDNTERQILECENYLLEQLNLMRQLGEALKQLLISRSGGKGAPLLMEQYPSHQPEPQDNLPIVNTKACTVEYRGHTIVGLAANSALFFKALCDAHPRTTPASSYGRADRLVPGLKDPRLKAMCQRKGNHGYYLDLARWADV